MDATKKAEIEAEVVRLKALKQRAVEEEEFEEAATLKRRIKVLEDTLGEQVKYEERQAAAILAAKATPQMPKAVEQNRKPLSKQDHGAALSQMPSETMKLMPEEREFVQKSRMAMQARGITDNCVNGVPQWAYKDAIKDGLQGVKTERPAELQYVFKGQIEDERWEEGANFQTSVIVQVPVEVAFVKALGLSSSGDEVAGGDGRLKVGPNAHISHHVSGTAQLTELLDAEVVENDTVAFRIIVTKPKVRGKVKLEAARTAQTREPFLKQPFYSLKSVWRFHAHPAGGTHIVRIIFDFKQFELLEFDALRSVSRAIELENESIRQSWSVAVSIAPDKTLANKPSPWKRPGATSSALAKCNLSGGESEMYNASFVVEASPDEVFNALASNELLFEYNCFLQEGSLLRLDDSRVLLRQANGVVLLVTSRIKADQRHLLTMTVAHNAGKTMQAAMAITTDKQVMADPFYRVVNDWICMEHGDSDTLVRRTMRDFKQTGCFEISDLATMITEVADEENRRILEAFRKRKLQEGKTPSARSAPTAISTRANYAMRQMPEILDMAAKNNVLEVREMLEVKGADPNYIHVRQDTWVISDSRLTFYEEITPLIVAAEYGACEVLKVLFNHPQIDVNMCCCAFSDLEIYNYYTAYDMTISRKHPHAAALLRARGVLPASSEHVFKPPFDKINMRPLRETINNMYGADEIGVNEMPSWEVVSAGDPKLATALREVADTLSITKSQALTNRNKIFKSLVTDWHPDRHTSTGESAIATKVFQWLQVVKPWYFEASDEPETDQQPLPGFDYPDRPVAPDGAQQYLHPSGSVFQVW